MSYRDFKDFPGRTASDKVMRDKTFNIAKNPKYDGYQRVLASVLYNFLFKKSSAANKLSYVAALYTSAGGAAKSEIMLNQELAEYTHLLFGVLIFPMCNW